MFLLKHSRVCSSVCSNVLKCAQWYMYEREIASLPLEIWTLSIIATLSYSYHISMFHKILKNCVTAIFRKDFLSNYTVAVSCWALVIIQQMTKIMTSWKRWGVCNKSKSLQNPTKSLSSVENFLASFYIPTSLFVIRRS